MRIVKSILVATCITAFFGVSFSQNSAKVYIGQTTDKIYYSVYVNPVVLETLDAKSAKDYVKNGDYSIGDLVKIPIQLGADKNAHTAYAKIIGQVSPDFLTSINDNVIIESKKRFGEDNVEPWPEQYLERNPWGIKYNEKAITCKYYIISSLTGFTPHVDLPELGEGSSIPASEGLICYNITRSTTDDNVFKVEQLEDFTTSNFTLVLKNKVKAGKKGKNIAKDGQSDLTQEDKTISKIVTKDIQTVSENRNESILEAWEEFFSPEIMDELMANSDKFLQQNMNSTVEKFFVEVDENL